MTNAYRYVRFSDPKQDKGSSQERQLERCGAFIKERGWTLVETISDLGRSAWTGAHLKVGNLGRFAERVWSGEIEAGSVLVVEHLDRLSRQDPRITQRWLEDITDAGLTIANVSNGRIYDRDTLRSPTGMMEIMIILIDAWAANRHSENLSGRLKDSWVARRRAIEAGEVIGGRIPGWLKLVDGRFVAIPERVSVVVLIYEMAAEGHGQRTIARHLNRTDIKPWGVKRGGEPSDGWEHTYVADILKSPAVEGDYEPATGRHSTSKKTGQRMVGYYGAPILDADLIARARASVASRQGTGGKYRNNFRNLFVGLMYCSACSGKMTLRSAGSKKARFLQCNNCFGGRGCTETAMFYYQDFETAALDVMLSLALDSRFFQVPDASRDLAIKAAEAHKAVDDAQRAKDRLLGLLERTHDLDVEARFMETAAQVKALTDTATLLDRKLEAARGNLSAAEHARRVLDVRASLNDPDDKVRLAARMKVTEALKGVVTAVWCEARDTYRGTPEKTLTMALVGGVDCFKFVHRGSLIGRVDLAGLAYHSKAMTEGLVSGAGVSGSEMGAYLRRRQNVA